MKTRLNKTMARIIDNTLKDFDEKNTDSLKIKEVKEKTPFPLEKILICSMLEYCEAKKNPISYYTIRGIHIDDDLSYGKPLISGFQKIVPEGTEVVVGFIMAIGGAGKVNSSQLNQYASGIALIPKD